MLINRQKNCIGVFSVHTRFLQIKIKWLIVHYIQILTCKKQTRISVRFLLMLDFVVVSKKMRTRKFAFEIIYLTFSSHLIMEQNFIIAIHLTKHHQTFEMLIILVPCNKQRCTQRVLQTIQINLVHTFLSGQIRLLWAGKAKDVCYF